MLSTHLHAMIWAHLFDFDIRFWPISTLMSKSFQWSMTLINKNFKKILSAVTDCYKATHLRSRDDCPRCRSKMKVMFREESGMRKRAALLRRKKASLRNKRNRRWGWERERECVCVCVRERESVFVCVRERERKRETSKKDKICKTLSYLDKKSNRSLFSSLFFFFDFCVNNYFGRSPWSNLSVY